MELVFRPDGVVAGRWESTGAVLVQYGIFLAALCLSVQALNCVVWHEARHETVWKTWQKWGVMTVTVLLAVAPLISSTASIPRCFPDSTI